MAGLVHCPSCGATNRVPADRPGAKIVCGRCKTPLQTAAPVPLVVTDATFEEAVERAVVPVLIDLWAPWCGPCRMVSPIVDQLASEFAGRVLVAKMNVDENPATAARFNVFSIPTLLVMKAGREVDRLVGVQPKEVIARRLETLA